MHHICLETMNPCVVKSGTIPHSQLHKRHHGLSYHYTREAVASQAVSFHFLPGHLNPADALSKHWGYQQVWPVLQPVLFWRGDTGKLIAMDNAASKAKEGSDKCPVPKDAADALDNGTKETTNEGSPSPMFQEKETSSNDKQDGAAATESTVEG